MKIGGTIGDPIVTDLVVLIVTITLVFGVGAEITKQMVDNSQQVELDKCQEKFGDNFSNGTMDGEFVCMKDGEVYNPDVHALNSETNNPMSVLIPFELPSWTVLILPGIAVYLVVAMIFGCPFCMLPDLAWGPKLVVGAVESVLWKLNLYPEKLKEYCDYCDEVIPPGTRRIEKHKADFGDFVVCDDECSKNLDQELEDQEND